MRRIWHSLPRKDRPGPLGKLPVEANTLYPLLRRLESQGLLTSEWDTSEARPRKFYQTSPAGTRLAAALVDEWRDIGDALGRLTPDSKGAST